MPPGRTPPDSLIKIINLIIKYKPTTRGEAFDLIEGHDLLPNLLSTNSVSGQGIKSRISTGGNAISKEFARLSTIKPTHRQIELRDEHLKISQDRCFYCKTSDATTEDHVVPTNKRTLGVFGAENNLNKVPCCKDCNSSKSALTGDELHRWLINKDWAETDANRLMTWIGENENMLYCKENVDHRREWQEWNKVQQTWMATQIAMGKRPPPFINPE